MKKNKDNLDKMYEEIQFGIYILFSIFAGIFFLIDPIVRIIAKALKD